MTLFALLACTREPSGPPGPPHPLPPHEFPTEGGDFTYTWDSGYSGDFVPFEVDCPTAPEAPPLPFAYPLPTLDPAQVEEVKQCDLWDQIYAYASAGSACPETPCEWTAAAATQMWTHPEYYYAYTYAYYYDDGAVPRLPEPEASLARAMEANPGFLLTFPALAAMWYTPKVASAPPPDPVVRGVELTYDWTGMGDPVEWQIAIADADTEPIATGTVDGAAWSGTVDARAAQALGAAFTDLVPIAEWVRAMPCWDNYPDWTMDIDFADGTRVHLATHRSNVVGFGGPWQLELDGQRWFQASPALVLAVADLVDGTDLPFGSPALWGCGGDVSPPMIEQAWP